MILCVGLREALRARPSTKLHLKGGTVKAACTIKPSSAEKPARKHPFGTGFLPISSLNRICGVKASQILKDSHPKNPRIVMNTVLAI